MMLKEKSRSTTTPGMGRLLRRALCVSSFVLLSAGAPALAQTGPTLADYQAAAKLMPTRLLAAVKNGKPSVHWIGDTQWAWYQRDAAAGSEFLLVDAASGKSEPAFDAAAVAAALTKAGETAAASGLPVADLQFSPDRRTVTITTKAHVLTWDRTTQTGAAVPAKPPAARFNESLSPDGRWAAFRKADNLWIRDVQTGAERALTDDGAPYLSYGKLSDASLMAVRIQRYGMQLPPIGLIWSPDSSRLLVPRIDERAVRAYPYLQSVPDKGMAPVAYAIRRAQLGDVNQTITENFVIDVATGAKRKVEVPTALIVGVQDGADWWSSDQSKIFALGSTSDNKTLSLLEIDAASGAVRTIIDEPTARTYSQTNVAIYNGPNVRVLGGGKEVVWFSERDGYGHLYLYDGAGRLKRLLTPGPSVVFDVIAVDEKRRELYYTGSVKAGEGNPYERMLYRVSLDRGAPVRLTPPGLDHAVAAAPSRLFAMLMGAQVSPSSVSSNFQYFVDTASTVGKAPVSVIRSTRDGREVTRLATADTTALDALGYVPPEPFTVKAADGKTDLYGVIYWPPNRKSGQRIPVVDGIYNGPQVSAVPHNFLGAFNTAATAPAALARLGFAVFVLDARGTAGRDKAFHDSVYGAFADAGIPDHIAAMKQLAERNPELDLSRVGIYGASFGGYYSANAVLRHPEAFHAAFSVAGPYQMPALYSNALEVYQGKPVYAPGATPGEAVPTNYADTDLTKLAPNLKGALTLAAGDVDENAPPAQTLALADALAKANKEFDLIIMPNHVHAEMWDPYVVQRMWNFFVRNLQSGSPPKDFSITAAK
ncbi:S9 family peptidase [Caulobacter soli]|uniref:S9 family peptidase n=1 Tax=Caulobacter soli TaxID=2708539 RepID=UPI0013EC253A|nr:DPP IV N-terminal domain-containing protein [Caulobacter soli]